MTLVLIGPVCAGKSTVLAELGGRLDRPTVDLDSVAEAYYEEVGRSRAAMQEIGGARGDLRTYRWWQEGHPHAVRRLFEDHPSSLVALGAGHTVDDDPPTLRASGCPQRSRLDHGRRRHPRRVGPRRAEPSPRHGHRAHGGPYAR